MSVKIQPRKLKGQWTVGYVLDVHTTSSTFLGHNEYGHPEFETTRSPLGELLFRLKNRRDLSAIEPIMKTVADFLLGNPMEFDLIVPVPPSNPARKIQPVLEVARALCGVLEIPLCESCVSKNRSTPQLKNEYDRAKRVELLTGAFSVNSNQTRGKSILVFDDLYRSGATAGAIARLLTEDGAASSVSLLTLTQTRRKL